MNKYLESDDFIKAIDNQFWKHITNEAIIIDCEKYNDIEQQLFLKNLARQVNEGNYRPKACKTIGFPKTKGILRPVYHMSIEDSIIYYYCIRKIQDGLVKKISSIEYMFGGFRITKELRINETYLDEIAYDPEYECFAKTNFRKSWSDYQNLAKRLSDGHYDYYLHLDIAHFYDSIPLDDLERKIRAVATDNQKIVDLLFYLLRNIKSETNYTYNENMVGIPQEEVGEMSRLLANYYLHYFDKTFVEELKKFFNSQRGLDYQYTRYADDLWIVYRGEEDYSFHIAQIASQLLQNIGLHLNEAKTLLLSEKKYREFWAESLWDEIVFKKNKTNELLKILKNIYSNKNDYMRWFTPFHYGLKMLANKKDIFDSFDEEDYEWFEKVIVENHKLINRNNKTFINFVENLIKKNEKIRERICNSLISENHKYPIILFTLSTIFINCKDEYIQDYFKTIYFKPSWQDLYWYQRCIALDYYTKNADLLNIERNKDFLKKIKKHIKNISEDLTDPERRYTIKFLVSIPMQKGQDVLQEKFNSTIDNEFITYLRQK